MFMKRYFIIILFTVYAGYIFAQGTLADAENFFNSGNAASAATVYEQLLAKKPTDAMLNYKLGRCYYEMGNLQLALPFFEIAKEKYPASFFYIGLYCKENYRFDEAKSAFEFYLAAATDSVFIQKAKNLLRQTSISAEMITRIEDIALIDSITVDKKDFIEKYKIPNDLGIISMTVEKNASQTSDITVFTTERNDRRIFSQINGKQIDILSSYKLTDEQWAAPVSVSQEINTLYNENYPFLMTDGVTFYFASDNENSIGGYDIFMTRFNPAKNDFYTPENVGMPFNSPCNDYMMVIDDVRGIGYFASDRYQPEDKVTIYRFLFEKEKKIIRSDDSESLIKYAQLKLARKVNKSDLIDSQSSFQEDKQKDVDFQFYINSQTAYYSISEFRNQEAANLFRQLEKEKINIENLKKELESLRNAYALATVVEKQILAPKILELEKDIPLRENALSAMQQNIRTLENNALNNK